MATLVCAVLSQDSDLLERYVLTGRTQEGFKVPAEDSEEVIGCYGY